MKTINVTFEDNEFVMLEKAKGKLNWHDFIMSKNRTIKRGGKDGKM